MDPETLKLAVIASGAATLLTVMLACRAFFRGREARLEAAEEAAKAIAEADAHAGEVQGLARFRGLASVMRPKTVEELSEMRRELARAGMRANDAVAFYSALRAIAMLAGGGLFFLLVVGTALDPAALLLGSVVLGFAFLGPKWWLRMQVKARQEALNRSLPPTLDLLVTCMEAGLGLEQAIARVAAEIGYSDPEMSEELAVVVGEMRAGLSVGATFKKLADRVTSDEVRNMSNVIIQSATLGASLGRTLREYASSSRRRRELALEEMAGKVTAGLTLPLTLCLLPSAVIAILGPAVVMVMNSVFLNG